MARSFKFWRTTLLLITLLLLGACSSTTFVYNRLDFLLPWYLDDYVELEGKQDELLDDLLQPFLAQHRSEELPRYVGILSQIEGAIDEPLSSADMELIWHSFEQAYLRLEQDALEWLLVLGDELSQQQLQDFVDTLDEKQLEYREEYLERDNQEYAEDSYDYMQDTLKEYLGRLNREQKEMLRVASEKMHRSDQAWLDERAAWLHWLRSTLQRKPGWQQEILTAIETREENLPAEYVEVTEHNAQVLYALFAQVFNSRNEKQDKYLREKMAELKEDLNTLIAQADKAKSDAVEQPCSRKGC